MVIREGDSIKMFPVPRLSKMAGVDTEILKGRKPSEEIEALRKEWTEEFENRVHEVWGKGTMVFYHPQGTHDDQLWALALAIYAAEEGTGSMDAFRFG